MLARRMVPYGSRLERVTVLRTAEVPKIRTSCTRSLPGSNLKIDRHPDLSAFQKTDMFGCNCVPLRRGAHAQICDLKREQSEDKLCHFSGAVGQFEQIL